MQEINEILVTVSSSLSLIGCTFVIVTWFLFSTPNYTSRKLIAFLSISGFFTALSFLLGVALRVDESKPSDKPSPICNVQAYAIQFFYLSTFLWTSCFATHLYQIIVRRNQHPEKFMRYYHLVCWGIPLVFDGILLGRQLTGHEGMGDDDRPWCWISNEEGGQWRFIGAWQQFGFFYIPSTLLIFYNGIMYIKLVREMKRDPMGLNVRNRLLLYIAVFLFCSIWALINRVNQMISVDHKPNKYLNALESIFDPLQGFLNALAYGINTHTLQMYKELFTPKYSTEVAADGLSDDEDWDTGLYRFYSPDHQNTIMAKGGYNAAFRSSSEHSLGSPLSRSLLESTDSIS